MQSVLSSPPSTAGKKPLSAEKRLWEGSTLGEINLVPATLRLRCRSSLRVALFGLPCWFTIPLTSTGFARAGVRTVSDWVNSSVKTSATEQVRRVRRASVNPAGALIRPLMELSEARKAPERHLPPLPALALCDFYLYGNLKNALKGNVARKPLRRVAIAADHMHPAAHKLPRSAYSSGSNSERSWWIELSALSLGILREPEVRGVLAGRDGRGARCVSQTLAEALVATRSASSSDPDLSDLSDRRRITPRQ